MQSYGNSRREVIIYGQAVIVEGRVVPDGRTDLDLDGIELMDGDESMPIIGFEASEELIKQLDELKQQTDSVTRAEIFRKALKTYAFLTKKVRGGNEVAVVDADGKVAEKLILP